MVMLIILGLLCAAALYGLFFLFFKLIWVLCKKKRNLWPLVLAGAATAAVVGFTAFGLYRLADKYIRPFNPIIQAAKAQTQYRTGSSLYIDPEFGWSMHLFNGMTMSDWIYVDEAQIKIATDTNYFFKNKPENEPFQTLVIMRLPTDGKSPAAIYRQTDEGLREVQEQNKNLRIERIDYASVQGYPALRAGGQLVSDQGNRLDFQMILVAFGREAYMVLGLTSGDAAGILRNMNTFAPDFAAAPPAQLPAPAPQPQLQ